MSSRTTVGILALVLVGAVGWWWLRGTRQTPEAPTSAESPSSVAPIPIARRAFGQTADGVAVDLYTLQNHRGVKATITTYGAIITSLETPDRLGQSGDIVLGFDRLEDYVQKAPYFGSVVGRYANRIAKGSFTLDGKTYTLAKNNGENSLHGGVRGFDKQVWTARVIDTPRGPALELTYISKDGEEGYPGTLTTTVTYTLTEDNELRVEYRATTDKPTVVNLSQHSYFNLAGAGNGDVLGHQVMIAAESYTPVDEGLIPDGQLAPVDGTPFDFRTPTAIGARIDTAHQQLQRGRGYDHNYVLSGEPGRLRSVARVTEPTSGRVLEVLTMEPGVQFYTGNFLDGTMSGKGGKVYPKRGGFCLETQHYPDSPNKPSFPSTVLRPDGRFESTTIFKFLTDGHE